MYFKSFSDLVDEIKGILDVVSSIETDTQILAEDIAHFEQKLASVRYIAMLVILPFVKYHRNG